MVDAGGFEGEEQDRQEGIESDCLVVWFKDEWCPNHNMSAATETGVSRVGALTTCTGKLASRRRKRFAGNQLQARKQEYDYRCDPKDCYSRGHYLLLIISHVWLHLCREPI